MTTPYPKRLIEVDLPIRRISAHARREKSIRHGHISTLHIWWARRPLAACRAVICAALWPDPADELCPQLFRDAVARLLPAFAEQVRRSSKLAELCTPESFQRWMRTTEGSWRADHPGSWFDMRAALLDFIADFANWDASTAPAYLETARGLTQAAHEALGGEPGSRPLVVDPFAGGGAIPLEALRVGADAFASDLNPVAVLLNKVVLEYIPKYGNAELRMMNAEGEEVVFQGLAEAVRYWGQWIKEQAERELAEFYPKDPDGATPIAYLWARTIRCEGPGCGIEVPLMTSLWLDKVSTNKAALRLLAHSGEEIDFEIILNPNSNEVMDGTVKRGAVICPRCGYTTPKEAVRAQLKRSFGGARDARLLAVVTTYSDQKGRFFRLPVQGDVDAVGKARIGLEQAEERNNRPLSLMPSEPYPDERGAGALSSSVLYGLRNWGDLFTYRQGLLLITLVRLIEEVGQLAGEKYDSGGITALKTCLALALDRQADHSNSGCAWNPSGPKLQHLFTRQALPMVWDFAEAQPFGDSVGDWSHAIDCVLIALGNASYYSTIGYVEQGSATSSPLPNDSVSAFVTDPPYYDAIAYADLADFFYVWLKRTVGQDHPALFSSNLINKTNEIVHLSKRFRGVYDHKTKDFFETGMKQAMIEGYRILHPLGIGVVVFAHKTTSGWEAQLQAMIDAGWMITGSWPIDTEMGTRINAIETASLASSVHLVCRSRETNGVGDWREVLQELPLRIHAWLPRLAREGIVGADAIFACLGPALEIFSRYSRVEKASGEVMTLSTYLEHVWAAVSKEALDMVFQGADTSGFEEDARLTAMWLWTLGASGNGNGAQKSNFSEKLDFSSATPAKVVASAGYTLEFDAARKIAQGLGAHLEQLGHLVELKGSNARLLPAVERTRYLFGVESAKQPARRGKREAQPSLFEIMGKEEAEAAGWAMDDDLAIAPGRTVLDRVHQSMLLFAAGRSNALKRYLVEDGIGKDERFWSLAQALSALYPPHTDEKRWVDGVLARKKGLGF